MEQTTSIKQIINAFCFHVNEFKMRISTLPNPETECWTLKTHLYSIQSQSSPLSVVNLIASHTFWHNQHDKKTRWTGWGRTMRANWLSQFVDLVSLISLQCSNSTWSSFKALRRLKKYFNIAFEHFYLSLGSCFPFQCWNQSELIQPSPALRVNWKNQIKFSLKCYRIIIQCNFNISFLI